eukprot:92478-Lingulodinium_polyedra.AAC.1
MSVKLCVAKVETVRDRFGCLADFSEVAAVAHADHEAEFEGMQQILDDPNMDAEGNGEIMLRDPVVGPVE